MVCSSKQPIYFRELLAGKEGERDPTPNARHPERSRTGAGRRWLDACHDELLAALGGQRVNWSAFAAHLNKLKLTDGKGGEATASVARNTWHRVKAAHRADSNSAAERAPATGAQALAHADQGGVGNVQAGGGFSSPLAEVPVEDENADQGAPASGSGDYPPGIRALAAPVSIGDSAPAAPDLPKHSPSAAPDHAPTPSPSEGEHHTGESTSWTATFATKPSNDILDLLKKNGGKWDSKRACWSGASANDLSSLTAAVKVVGGSFQSHQTPSP